MGVGDVDGAKLGDREDGAGEDQAPGSVGVHHLHEEIGTDAFGWLAWKWVEMFTVQSMLTTQQPTTEARNGQDRDVQLLPVDEEGFIDRAVVELPESLDVLTDVAAAVSGSPRCDFECRIKATYLIVIKPMPARMPKMDQRSQKSGLRSKRHPRISIRWDRSKSTLSAR